MSVELIADGIIDLIKKNIIAKTDVISDVSVGDSVVSVYNSYRFHPGEEIVLIDYGYNSQGHIHFNVFEYAKIKYIENTNSIVLESPTQGEWKVSDKAFIQKTIAHSPLYENNVFYGDRDVVAVDDIVITVEPVSLGNDWIYIQGGLSEEYRVKIMIYGKSIETEEGRRILDRYSYAVYSLLNSNIHIDLNDYETPLVNDYLAGTFQVVIEDTPLNREKFVVSPRACYRMQDNEGATCFFRIIDRVISGGLIHLSIGDSGGLASPITESFFLSDFAVIRAIGEYIYDSRVDGIQYGQVSKGSAFLRASELNWFGKKVNDHLFPQTSDGVDDFEKISEGSSSSSSSSSIDSSSSSSLSSSESSSSLSSVSSLSSLSSVSSSSSSIDSSSSSLSSSSSSIDSSSSSLSSSSSSIDSSSSSSIDSSSSSSSYPYPITAYDFGDPDTNGDYNRVP